MNKPNPLIQELFEEMSSLRRLMHGSGEYMMGKFQLTRPQTEVLFLLLHHPSLSVGDIAAKTGVTTSAATQTLDIMVRRGLVERQADTADRRVSHQILTDEGKAMARAAKARSTAVLTEVMSEMEPAELKDLIKTTRKLQQLIERKKTWQ